MLLLVQRLDHRVAHFTLHIRIAMILARSILLLDLIVHLNEILLTLLFLVLLHELLDHFFSVLLALLADVFLDKFVYTADFLLLGGALSYGSTHCVVAGGCGVVTAAHQALVTFALASFALVGPFFPLLVVTVDNEWFHQTVELTLVSLSRQEVVTEVHIAVKSRLVNVISS